MESINQKLSLTPELEALIATTEALAENYQDDHDRLLQLLRVLESLHRRIRIDYFEPALPNTRRGLYGLLRDIEESGGWPYIERGKLTHFIKNLQESLEQEVESLGELEELD
ncbi:MULTISPECIES: hypothetical protein [unclassified Synechocystis]|uniref:hypothetical protein n=1 Tax=unclassified Synechocystis TaxID=2640012 RepID=UPI000401A619|nr:MULTISPECIES: hypothetical protein [unclassified Synechocystis]AIE75690.1 hypothetical protein D082_31620 [Synechocystis sp. PCC 6714]MCT0253875.1 hypothetical protein [Synechocystis sp. CS-94]